MSWFDSLAHIGANIGHGVSSAASSVQHGVSSAASSIQHGASTLQHDTAGSDHAQSFGKASGLSPYMKMLGMTPAAAPPEDRMAKPSELADLKAGKAFAAPGGEHFTNDVTGNHDSKGLKMGDGGHAPSYQHWDTKNVPGVSNKSSGNRQSDIDARDAKVKVGAPEVYQPDLSKIKHNTTGQKADENGAGSFTDTAWGTHTDAPSLGVKTKIDPVTGEGYTSIASAGYQAGGEYKTGGRAVAMSKDKRYSASAEGGFVASGGVSGSVGLDTKNGLQATGGVGGKVGLYGQADANAKTGSVKVGGVDYDIGGGVHADAFVGAKAGAGGTVGIGPNFVGAKGNIGAFAGAEAAVDAHANLGPLAGKVGASGMAGAGIGADGDISYKDGKFHVGGKMFAALGYGGSLSGDVTVDVGGMAKSAYNLGATGLDYAGKGLNAAEHGLESAGHAVSQGASNLYHGAANLFSW